MNAVGVQYLCLNSPCSHCLNRLNVFLPFPISLYHKHKILTRLGSCGCSRKVVFCIYAWTQSCITLHFRLVTKTPRARLEHASREVDNKARWCDVRNSKYTSYSREAYTVS
jgi:hypothetical protein